MKYKIIFIGILFIIWIGFINFGITKKLFHSGGNISNTTQATGSDEGNKSCIKNPKIYIYMYHYVRPDSWEEKNGPIYKNTVLPEEFDNQMKYLKGIQDKNDIYIGFLGELEKFQNEWCFPNKNIVILTADDGWYDSYAQLFPVIKKYGIKFNLGIIFNNVGKDNKEIGPFMTENQIKTMFKSGLINISSHSMTHRDFRSLTNEQKKREMCQSKIELEKMFNIRVNSFIYPAGQLGDVDNSNLVQECGYDYGIGTKYGIMDIDHLKANYFNLRRIRVSRESDIRRLFKFE